MENRQIVVITEQPHPKALRARSTSLIPGQSSTPEAPTFPSIEIRGYRGRAVVVVSCVTKDPPYRPHPHRLTGADGPGYRQGVFTGEVPVHSMTYIFENMSIESTMEDDIEEELRSRENIRVDPFRTGFGHSRQPEMIDLTAVRLCFQVFLEGQQAGRFTEPLKPIVSDVICDEQ